MVDTGFIAIIVLFLIYYFAVLIVERKIVQDPKDIIEKFLSVLLFYAGISLIYFSLTGNPLLEDTTETYSVYIFIIGFIAVLWTVPNLLQEFTFFQKFLDHRTNKLKIRKPRRK